MLLPELKVPKREKAIIAFPTPELKFLVKGLNFKHSTKFLNTRVYFNSKALLVGPVLGAPSLGVVLRALKEKEVKWIVALGWCGSANSNLNPGDVFLPEEAVSKEGVTRCYFKRQEFFPDKALFSLFLNQLKQTPVFTGKILSVDCPWNITEVPPFVDAVDMETSALFSLSEVLNFKSIALHFVTDRVGEQRKSTSNLKLEPKRKEVLKALEIFLNF